MKRFVEFLKNSNTLKEKWVEYDFNFGEDKKEGMEIKKKYRKKFNLASSLPGEINVNKDKNK